MSDIGDEPLQIKLKFPDVHVAVESNRVKGVKTLIESIHKLDAVILDDAFQHRYIRPGLSILLVDYNRPVFKDMLLPAGNLREPRQKCKTGRYHYRYQMPGAPYHPMKERFLFPSCNPLPKQEIYFTKYTYGTPMPVFPDKHGMTGSHFL